MKTIYFDMDGTLVDLYGCEGWLNSLRKEYTKPYREGKALINMRTLSRLLNNLQKQGYKIGVVSWLSKTGTPTYNQKVTQTKIKWFDRHLSSVKFDEVIIVEYGTPKQEVVSDPLGILFDDEEQNRKNWSGVAYDVNNILEVLSNL